MKDGRIGLSLLLNVFVRILTFPGVGFFGPTLEWGVNLTPFPTPNLPPKGANFEKCMVNASLHSNEEMCGEKILIDQFPALEFNFEFSSDLNSVCMEKYATF